MFIFFVLFSKGVRSGSVPYEAIEERNLLPSGNKLRTRNPCKKRGGGKCDLPCG